MAGLDCCRGRPLLLSGASAIWCPKLAPNGSSAKWRQVRARLPSSTASRRSVAPRRQKKSRWMMVGADICICKVGPRGGAPPHSCWLRELGAICASLAPIDSQPGGLGHKFVWPRTGRPASSGWRVWRLAATMPPSFVRGRQGGRLAPVVAGHKPGLAWLGAPVSRRGLNLFSGRANTLTRRQFYSDLPIC